MIHSVQVLDLQASSVKQVELPPQFGEEIRPDLIRRAFHAEATLRLQPKGVFPLAGKQTTAEYFGRRHRTRQSINTGRARLPREKLPQGRLGRVRQVPHAVGGRRAHPPKPHKKIVEKINFREKNFAIRSAISATADASLVRERGHEINGVKFPLVVSSSIEVIKRVAEAKKILNALGIQADLQRAVNGRRLRSGRARLRKGGFRTPKSVLIVYGEDQGIWRATRNLPGVDAVPVEKLTAELLAPGGVAGRFTLWTESALDKLAKQQLFM